MYQVYVTNTRCFPNDSNGAINSFPRRGSQKRFGRKKKCLLSIFSCSTLQFTLALLEPQSRSGDKLPEVSVVCPQNGTAVLKGLMTLLGQQRGEPPPLWDDYSHSIGHTA